MPVSISCLIDAIWAETCTLYHPEFLCAVDYEMLLQDATDFT